MSVTDQVLTQWFDGHLGDTGVSLLPEWLTSKNSKDRVVNAAKAAVDLGKIDAEYTQKKKNIVEAEKELRGAQQHVSIATEQLNQAKTELDQQTQKIEQVKRRVQEMPRATRETLNKIINDNKLFS